MKLTGELNGVVASVEEEGAVSFDAWMELCKRVAVGVGFPAMLVENEMGEAQ
jgi:hypothetical protein